MSKQPLISVIMSVYNEEAYIETALRSLLTQTVDDFEIIMIDDCSTDQTCKKIRELKDDRICLYENDVNRGLTKNLNKALKLAKGQYIARMDGDDISMPDRFQRQLAYLEKHPELELVSCQTQNFGNDDLVWKLKGSAEELRIRMLIRPVLAHPGFMMRRRLIETYGFLYDESFRSAQDYDFAARVTRQYQIGIVPYILLKYRTHDKQVSSTSMSKQFQNADRVRCYLMQELGMELSEQAWNAYHALVQEKQGEDIDEFFAAAEIIKRLLDANCSQKIYPQAVMETVLWQEFYLWVIRNKSGRLFWKIYCKNHKAEHNGTGMRKAVWQIICNKL